MWILSVPLIHSTHHKERINEEENGILSNERASQNGTKNRSRRKAKAVSRHRMYFVCTVVNLQTRFSHAYLITCYIIIVILRHILFLFFPIFVKTSTSSVQAHVTWSPYWLQFCREERLSSMLPQILNTGSPYNALEQSSYMFFIIFVFPIEFSTKITRFPSL